jgi:ketosteroid isomerase-like protein
MSQENVEIVRRVWASAEKRDQRAVFMLYDPAIEWESHDVGSMELAGVYHGHEGVRRFVRVWLEAFETFDAQGESFIDAGDRVVVRYRVIGRGKRSGIDVEMLRWNTYEVRDGLVTRVELFASEAEALDAADLPE